MRCCLLVKCIQKILKKESLPFSEPESSCRNAHDWDRLVSLEIHDHQEGNPFAWQLFYISLVISHLLPEIIFSNIRCCLQTYFPYFLPLLACRNSLIILNQTNILPKYAPSVCVPSSKMKNSIFIFFSGSHALLLLRKSAFSFSHFCWFNVSLFQLSPSHWLLFLCVLRKSKVFERITLQMVINPLPGSNRWLMFSNLCLKLILYGTK